MHKHHIFLTILAGFVWGIVCGVFWYKWGSIAIIGSIVLFLLGMLIVPRVRVFVLAMLWSVSSVFGLWWAIDAVDHAQMPRVLDGAEIDFEGVVLRDARRGVFDQRIVVGLRECSIENSGDEKVCPLKRILIHVPLYGEQVAMRFGVSGTCILKQVQNFSQDFDYVMYLAKDYVYYECDVEESTHWVSYRRTDRMYALLADMRARMEDMLMQNVSQPQAALAAGLLFGGDERLSEYWQQQFAITGLSHIVAVSGYNVTVIAHALIMLGIFMGMMRRWSVWLAITGIILFILMIGAPSPAIRAGIMGVTVLLLMYTGRLSQALPALLFAGAAMLLVNPLLVRYDVGFQLSFLATLGIVVFYPIISRIIIPQSWTAGFMEILLMTVSAQVFVVPVILYHFQTFATTSLVANLLILPIVPLVMLVSILTLTFGAMIPGVLVFGGWCITILLMYVFAIVNWLARVPYAQIVITDNITLMVCLWYSTTAIIIALVYLRKKKQCTHAIDENKE